MNAFPHISHSTASPRVRLLVLLKSRRRWRTPFAGGARIRAHRLLSGVRPDVDLQAMALREPLPTGIALVRFLSAVGPVMTF